MNRRDFLRGAVWGTLGALALGSGVSGFSGGSGLGLGRRRFWQVGRCAPVRAFDLGYFAQRVSLHGGPPLLVGSLGLEMALPGYTNLLEGFAATFPAALVPQTVTHYAIWSDPVRRDSGSLLYAGSFDRWPGVLPYVAAGDCVSFSYVRGLT